MPFLFLVCRDLPGDPQWPGHLEEVAGVGREERDEGEGDPVGRWGRPRQDGGHGAARRRLVLARNVFGFRPEVQKEFREQDHGGRECKRGSLYEKEPAQDVGLAGIHWLLQAASPFWLENTSGCKKDGKVECSPGAGGRQAGGGPGGSEATSRHLAAAKQWDGPGFQHILQIQHNFVHLGQKLSDLQGLHKTTLSFFGNPRGAKDPRRGRHRSEWPQRPPASWSIEKGFRPGGGGVYHNHKRKGLWIARLT